MKNSYVYILIIPFLLTMCLAESYSALTAFGSSSTQNQQQNYDKQGSRRTRECKSDEECAAIQNTSCMSDPRDYKMRCLCRDSSAPINGACPNRPRAVGSPCKMDSECIDGSECKSMNISITSFKTCQCREGYMSRDGYCSNAFRIQVPSAFTICAVTLAHLIAKQLGPSEMKIKCTVQSV